jgi:hypothetical protein
MKDDDFHRIERELQEQMYNERKQHSRGELWGTHFDHATDGPLSLESQGTFTSEETFYSLTDNDIEFTPEPAVKTNVYPTYGQGLVQRVSEAGIVPLCSTSPNDVRQNGTFLRAWMVIINVADANCNKYFKLKIVMLRNASIMFVPSKNRFFKMGSRVCSCDS